MKMKEGTIFLVVLTFAFFGVSSGERKLIRLDEQQRLADEGTQWEILISNFLLIIIDLCNNLPIIFKKFFFSEVIIDSIFLLTIELGRAPTVILEALPFIYIQYVVMTSRIRLQTLLTHNSVTVFFVICESMSFI